MKLIKISILVVTVIVAGVLLYSNSNEQQAEEHKTLSIKHRKFDNQEFVLIDSFSVVGKIIRMFKDKNNIWLSDGGVKTVYEYTERGELVKSYGRDGGAMWENGSIWFFSKYDDSYYMYDYTKNVIRKHNINTDSVEYYFKGSEQIGNTVDLEKDLFIYSSQTHEDLKFVVKNISTEETKKEWSVKDLVTDEFQTFPSENLSLIFEGEFQKNKKGDIVYMCYKFSCIFIIDSKDQMTLVRTIDGFDIPKSKNQDIGGGYVLNGIEPDNFVNYASTMDDSNFYVLSNVVSRSNRDVRILDIYSLKGKRYERSLVLPNFEDQRPVDIAIYDNKLTILFENYTVATYEISL